MEGQTGILAAAMRWPDLFQRLEGLAGKFEEHTPAGTPQEPLIGDGLDAAVVTAGECAGRAYVSEASCQLSGCDDPDLITELAVGSGRLVVGCGTDAVSGRYYLVAADGDGLLRCYHHCRGRLSRPFEWGEPLPTETEHPLDGDPSGPGLRAALRYFGFDPDPWVEKPACRQMRYRAYAGALLPPMRSGPLGRALAAHYHWFQSQPAVIEIVPAAGALEPTVRTQRTLIRRKLKYAVFPFGSAVRGARPGATTPRETEGAAHDRRDDGGWWNRSRQRAAEGA